jgi:hypothetical protein
MGFNSAFKGLNNKEGSTNLTPLNAQLNPILHLLALLGAHPILHVSWVRVNIPKSVHRNIFLQYNQQDELVISNYLFL